jgi:alpha-mannosidase
VPDPKICEFVKEWNTKYAWPKFVISSTSTAFKAFEERYGDKLPQVCGDWTPYWEDGAGSSANETALNRNSSDRLVQAQTLWAMLDASAYPADAFEEAWQNVLLYSEHTWGAYCSVTEPENKLTLEQWVIKQSYALEADKQSRALLAQALAKSGKTAASSAVEVFNTTSWARTELVVLSPELSAAGDRVTDKKGQPAASQRLGTGELAILAEAVPPFAARQYIVSAGEPFVKDKAATSGAMLDNGLLKIGVSEKTGGIVELRAKGIEGNLVDAASGHAMNDYLYLIGDNTAELQQSGPAKITVKEKGPLVASLLIESEAPGCNKLTREVRLLAGRDYAEFLNTVDKKRLAAKNYTAKNGKESINFAFPLNVPDGEMLLDVPLGAIRPNLDQMPSACKNWLCVGRWADASNRDYGVTWITLDAPLVELGGITANLLNSQSNPNTWRKNIEPTQTLYSWAMNNHWHTNYRAYQDGPTEFRFAVRPHGRFNPVEAAKLATGLSQPLVAAPAGDSPRSEESLLKLQGDDVLVIALKPSDDGKAWIVRLFGASGKDAKTNLVWSAPGPKQIFLSDTSEKPLRKIEGPIDVPAWEIVTIRAERQ